GLSFGIQGVVLLKFQERKKIAQEAEKFATPKKYKGVYYESKELLKIRYDIEGVENFFISKSMENYPSFLLLILTSCSFGLVGSALLLTKKIVIGRIIPEYKDALLLPVLGLLSGIIVLGFAELVPTLLIEGEGVIRPITLVFMAFFSGLFVEKFYAWTEAKFDAIFK
ncbi:MAG: hypothetical protein ACI837_002138, partial [Crocinitomicaceae bacterium]